MRRFLEEISLTPKGNAAIFMVVFIANGPKRTGKTPFTFEIPSNATAKIFLPDGTEKTVGARKYEFVL